MIDVLRKQPPERTMNKWIQGEVCVPAKKNQDYNGDGDKTDILWIDDGSNKALDNAGF